MYDDITIDSLLGFALAYTVSYLFFQLLKSLPSLLGEVIINHKFCTNDGKTFCYFHGTIVRFGCTRSFSETRSVIARAFFRRYVKHGMETWKLVAHVAYSQ